MGGGSRVLIYALGILGIGGIVAGAEAQVSKLAGGVGDGMSGLNLGGNFVGSTHQCFQICGDLVSNSVSIGRSGTALFAVIVKSGNGLFLRPVSSFDLFQCVDTSTDLILLSGNLLNRSFLLP